MGTYSPPVVSASGLTIPSYTEVLNNLISSFTAIYGQDSYLVLTEADYQWISILAAQILDNMDLAQLVYNSRSPQTAIGAALDSLGKIMGGIVRASASYSSVAVTVTGVAGTVITNGTAQDQNGNVWALPSQVTIPMSGSITITAVCTIIGAVTANPGEVNIIGTPTAGWTSCNNSNAAVPGQPIQIDSQYRAQLILSTSLPSRTMLAATQAGIEDVAGVEGVFTWENFTGAVDSYGTPGHSISCVVVGGTDLAVAIAIWLNRGIGALTNNSINGYPTFGSTIVDVTDPNTGDITAIGFFRPTYLDLYVSLTVTPLAGYTTATAIAIQNAVVAYVDTLALGVTLISLSAIEAAIMAVNPNLANPLFSITALEAGFTPSPVGTSDLDIAFYEALQTTASNVTIYS